MFGCRRVSRHKWDLTGSVKQFKPTGFPRNMIYKKGLAFTMPILVFMRQIDADASSATNWPGCLIPLWDWETRTVRTVRTVVRRSSASGVFPGEQMSKHGIPFSSQQNSWDVVGKWMFIHPQILGSFCGFDPHMGLVSEWFPFVEYMTELP